MAQDRLRWWANPPKPMRPTPALAGWTLDEWIEASGLVEPAREERFRSAYPSTMGSELQGYDVRTIALEALQRLILEDEVERLDSDPPRWRARPKIRYPG